MFRVTPLRAGAAEKSAAAASSSAAADGVNQRSQDEREIAGVATSSEWVEFLLRDGNCVRYTFGEGSCGPQEKAVVVCDSDQVVSFGVSGRNEDWLVLLAGAETCLQHQAMDKSGIFRTLHKTGSLSMVQLALLDTVHLLDFKYAGNGAPCVEKVHDIQPGSAANSGSTTVQCENRKASICPDKATVAAIGAAGQVMLGQLNSSTLQDVSCTLGMLPVLTAVFSPDAEAIACAHEDGSVTTYSVSGSQLCVIQALPHTSTTQASSLVYLDADTLIVARATGQVEVWDLVRLQRLFEFPSPLGNEACIRLNIVNKSVVCSGQAKACILQVGQ